PRCWVRRSSAFTPAPASARSTAALAAGRSASASVERRHPCRLRCVISDRTVRDRWSVPGGKPLLSRTVSGAPTTGPLVLVGAEGERRQPLVVQQPSHPAAAQTHQAALPPVGAIDAPSLPPSHYLLPEQVGPPQGQE